MFEQVEKQLIFGVNKSWTVMYTSTQIRKLHVTNFFSNINLSLLSLISV